MINNLLVILGAGASYDLFPSEDPNYKEIITQDDYRPPLTKHLFKNHGVYQTYLKDFPKASSIASVIRGELRGRGEDNLEEILNELNKSDNFQRIQAYRQIPLYLQKLFFNISNEYTEQSTNYDNLVQKIDDAGIQQTLFLTLNYDLFLEKSLNRIYGVQFNEINDFIQKKWALIKLHGSADWWKRIRNNYDHSFTDGVEAINSIKENILDLSDDIYIRKNNKIRDNHSGIIYYPAISAPINDKKNYACDESHYNHLTQFLKTCTNIMIIGCSMTDHDLLDCLKENIQSISRLKIVTGQKDSAIKITNRLSNGLNKPELLNIDDISTYYNGNFSTALENESIVKFLT